MKKWITILLAAVLMICLLAGCQPADCEPADCEPTDYEPTDYEPTDYEPTDGEPAGTVEFTLEKALEINDAVWTQVDDRQRAESFCKDPWKVEGLSFGRQHMGSANGYIFFYLHNGHLSPTVHPQVIPEVEIGGVVFVWDCENCLYGYKDGNIYRVIDLYESGEISKEDVENIKKERDAYAEENNLLMDSKEAVKEALEEYSRWKNEMEENGWKYAHGWEPPKGE